MKNIVLYLKKNLLWKAYEILEELEWEKKMVKKKTEIQKDQRFKSNTIT